MQKMILHLDLDSFFVSVERLKNPALMGQPVIVGGEERGVVASCSYEARKMGVHSAMSAAIAKRLCPHAVFLKGDMAAYAHYSAMVTQIIAQEVPVMEKASIDEFYADFTGMDRFIGAWDWARQLRKKIMEETGLPISMGLSSGKTISKIATGEAKPNGELWVPAGMEKAFLAPLPIKRIPMAGEKTCQFLNDRGIVTIGQLAVVPLATLENLLGKQGAYLHEKANGICNRPIVAFSDPKSVSKETTFMKDCRNSDFMLAVMSGMVEQLAYKLRKSGMNASCVAVKIRYPNFFTHSQQYHINPSATDKVLMEQVKKLFYTLWDSKQAVRLIGVRLGELKSNYQQGNLFVNTEKEQNATKALDKVRDKFGWSALKRGISLELK